MGQGAHIIFFRLMSKFVSSLNLPELMISLTTQRHVGYNSRLPCRKPQVLVGSPLYKTKSWCPPLFRLLLYYCASASMFTSHAKLHQLKLSSSSSINNYQDRLPNMPQYESSWSSAHESTKVKSSDSHLDYHKRHMLSAYVYKASYSVKAILIV